MLSFLKKQFQKHRELILFALFGVLTTAVNWIIYFPLVNLFSVNYQVANVIGWIAAVIFAFFTNKVFVFGKKDFSGGTVWKEFFSFVGSRLFSLLVEMGLMWLFVEVLKVNENLSKIVVAVVVVILNYLTGKLIVFAKKK